MKALIVWSAVLSLLVLFESSSASGFTNAGREFFLAFFRNRQLDQDPIAYLLVTPSQPNSPPIPFKVEMPALGFTAQGTAVSGQFARINLPKDAVVSGISGFNKVIRVRADSESKGDLVVVGMNEDEASMDSYLALPAIRSPTGVYEYTAFSTKMAHLLSEGRSVILAVATEDFTDITITPTGSAFVPLARNLIISPGDSRTVTLDEMTMLYAVSDDDLTGTIIRSNKPLSVFVGHECGNVPFNVTSCDHLLEQVPPSDVWGRSYHTAPLFTRNGGDQFRVVASKNNTEVKMECIDASSKLTRTTVFELGYFKFETVLVASNEHCQFESNLPILVAQYSLGHSFDSVLFADPFISLIQSDEQFLNSYSFTTAKGEEVGLVFTSYLNIIIPTVYYDPAAIVIDGTPLLSQKVYTKSIVSVNFSDSFGVTVVTLGGIPIGSHFINHTDPNAAFSVLVYGYTDQKSYGFPAGYGQGLVSISTLSLEVESASLRENNGPFVFHCKRVGLTHFPMDITVATQELVGGAKAKTDFTPLHEVLHFEAGEVDRVVEVIVLDNTMQESDRSFKVLLMKEAGQASVALAETGQEVVVTILDDDAPAVIDLISREYEVTEGETVLTVGVRRTGYIDEDIKVTVRLIEDVLLTDGMIFGADEKVVVELTVVFNGSNTDEVEVVYVNIPIEDDDVVKEDRKLILKLVPLEGLIGGQGGDVPRVLTQTANVSVVDDDVVTFKYTQGFLTVSEGDKEVPICVNKMGNTTLGIGVGVLSSADTSEDGIDFIAVNIDLTFDPNDRQKCFNLLLIDDDVPEPTESFTLNLFKLSGEKAVIGDPGQLQIQIMDNDVINVTFSSSTVMGTEGMPSEVCIEHSPKIEANLPFLVNVTGGNATADDYMINLPNNLVTVVGSAGPTCFDVSLVTDRVAEGPEVVEFTLVPSSSLPANLSIQLFVGTTQLLIEDMDILLIRLKMGSVTVAEGGTGDLCVIKLGLTDQVIQVTIELTSTTDPEIVLMNFNPVVVFQPSDRMDEEICTSLTIPNDDVASGSPSLEFNLASYESQGAGVFLVTSMPVFVTVLDNDVLTIGFNNTLHVVNEGVGMVMVCLVTSEFRNQEPLQLFVELEDRSTNGTAGTDFASFTEVEVNLNLQAGQREACFSVTIMDDGVHEADEVIGLLLAPGPEMPGHIRLQPTRATIVVEDDDTVVVQMESSSVTVSEMDSQVDVCVVKVGETVFPITVQLATQGGSAMVIDDFLHTTTNVTIEPNATKSCINVTIIDDSSVEPDESLFVTLSKLLTTFERTVIGQPNTTQVFIQNDDVVTVQFEESLITVNESAGTSVEVCLLKEGMTSQDITVVVIAQELTGGNSASVSSDLATGRFEVTFAAGVPRACGVVSVVDDQVVEGEEMVAFNISTSTGAADGQVTYLVGERAQVVMVIRDDDFATIRFVNERINIIEGEPPFPLCATVNGTSAKPLWIMLEEMDIDTISGVDYVSVNGSMLHFAPFTTTVCINLTIIDDSLEEMEEEVFLIGMTSLSEGGITDQNTVMVTILDDDFVTVQFEESLITVNESAGTSVEVCLLNEGMTSQDITVVVIAQELTGGNSASVFSDLATDRFEVTFTAGVQRACGVVSVVDDQVVEGEEMVAFNISTSTGAVDGQVTYLVGERAQVVMVIRDDDFATIRFAEERINIIEGEPPFPLCATLNGTSAKPLWIMLEEMNIDTISGVDYVSINGSMLHFAPFTTTVCINLTIIDDSLEEMEEEVFLIGMTSLSEGGITDQNTVMVMILDDDSLRFAFTEGPYFHREGVVGPLVMCVEKTGITVQDFVFDINTTGSATAGTDFVLSTSTLSFARDQTEVCFEVTVSDDSLLEGNETIQVCLTTPGQIPLVAMVTIIDNDSAEISFDPLTYQINESDGGVTLSVAIVGEVATSLNYSITLTPMSADGSDFNSGDITRSLPLQSSNDSVVLEVFDDSIPEGREMFEATLVVPVASADKGLILSLTANKAVIVIEDDDIITVNFASDKFIVGEGDGVALVTVQSDRAASNDLNLGVSALSSNTATVFDDFVATKGVVVIPAGSTSAQVNITIVDDTIAEPTESFNVTLTIVTSQSVLLSQFGPFVEATVEIMDNDVISFEWERELYRVREGAGLFPLKIVSNLAASYGITLEFEVTSISAQENQNFEIVTLSPLVIPAGDRSVTVVTNILNDTIFEGNKTFSLRLLSLTAQEDVDVSPTLGSTMVTMVTITEDDMKVVLSFEEKLYTVSEDDKTMEACLITEGEELLTHSISVPIKFVNDTAYSGVDFVPPGSLLVPFSAGQRRSCVSVAIIDDRIQEETEMFYARLDTESSSMPQEVAVGSNNFSQLIITDNDNPLRQCLINSTVIVPFHMPNLTSPATYAMGATCQHVLVSTCSDFMGGPIRIDADFRGDRIETLAVRLDTTLVLLFSNETYSNESDTPTVGNAEALSQVTVERSNREITVNGGDGLVVVVRRYGENPSISITLSRDLLSSGTCGLCGSEEGKLAFRSTFPVRTNYTQDELNQFIESWKIEFEEGLFPVDPQDQQCATMRNDTVDIDPLLTIPLYLHDHPSEMYRKVALCYEVRGHSDTIYNLVSDKCVSVNGHYKELAPPMNGLNVLGAVGVVAIDNEGECVTIAVEQVLGTCMAKVNGEMLFSSFKKNGVVVDVTHDQVKISVPNCEMVNLSIWIMCQETAEYDNIKFVVTRGVNMWPTSHGLLGQYWNVPTYVSTMDPQSDTYQVTLKYPSAKERVFHAVYYSHTWLWRGSPCLYAGDSQGNAGTSGGDSILEGSIYDYVMDSLLDTDYSFSHFEGDMCTHRES